MVRRLADHVQCDPATLTEDQVRQYFRQEMKFSRSAMTIVKAALRCFFCEQVKVQGWAVFGELRMACPKVWPVVCPEEVASKNPSEISNMKCEIPPIERLLNLLPKPKSLSRSSISGLPISRNRSTHAPNMRPPCILNSPFSLCTFR